MMNMVEITIQRELRKQKSKKEALQKGNDLDNLIREFYEVKGRLRELSCRANVGLLSKSLMRQKIELLLSIKQELSKVSKGRADEIRKRLWEELGVMI